jgi:hypothetical protein
VATSGKDWLNRILEHLQRERLAISGDYRRAFEWTVVFQASETISQLLRSM